MATKHRTREGKTRGQEEGSARREGAKHGRNVSSNGRHPKPSGGGREPQEMQGEKDEGSEEKRRGEMARRATATSGKNRKNGKRLGRSLRTHPQPENTTLSVPTMKDLPA